MRKFACGAVLLGGLAVGLTLGLLAKPSVEAPPPPPADVSSKAPTPERLCRFDEGDIYDGKVVGLYRPLSVRKGPDAFTIKGETFLYAVSRKTGQIVSARVLGEEHLAPGSSLPDPYIGLFPEDDAGASPLGDSRTAL